MDYSSIISRNMAIMIDVCTNDNGAEFKRKNYQRVIDALRDCNTGIHTISDVDSIVKCGPRIRRKIEYIMEFGTDLPEVKEFLESSLDEGECSDCSSEHSYDSVTTRTTDSTEDDDPQYEHEEDDYESVGSNDTDSIESEVEYCTRVEALRAINMIEYSMLAEEGELRVNDALEYLQTVRKFVMSTL